MGITSPRASTRAYETPPVDHPNSAEHRRLLAQAIELLYDGKINALGDVTLAVSSATTTLSDSRIGPDSFIGFMPTTSNAAGALSGLYVSSRGKQTATLTHANNSQSDKTFRYVVLG